MTRLIITIDGPAASGKSTLAKLLAEKLDAYFLDTGAMYRAVTLWAMNKGIDLSSPADIAAMMDTATFTFTIHDGKTMVAIDGRDVSEDIRKPEVTENVHFVASAPLLRARLVEMQRQFATQYKRIVTEGRDQGTVAFPNADVKFFLTADPSERARRRQAELEAKGLVDTMEKTRDAMEKRDNSDKSRSVGALIPATDAILVDSTGLSIEQVLDLMMEHISSKK